MKYEKTQEDTKREQNDLDTNPIMRWLENQGAFKFNPGDILIKKNLTRSWDPQIHSYVAEQWVVEPLNSATGAPKKYVYAFENRLGIGYVRQLKANGEGVNGTLICVANFDPNSVRFELDPDFIDHTLIGEGEFEYNTEYINKKKFRQEAMEANRKLMLKTSSKKQLIEWYQNLKVDDEFWYGKTFDELANCKYKVKEILYEKKPSKDNRYYRTHKEDVVDKIKDNEWRRIKCEIVEGNSRQHGSEIYFDISTFSWAKVTLTRPHPMKDQLCAPQK